MSVEVNTRTFDASSSYWTNDGIKNWEILKIIERRCTDLLMSRSTDEMPGTLLLNEVYELLDLSETDFGKTVGWVYSEENPIGDNFVDFGIGSEPSNQADYVLEFNHDGNINDAICKYL